MIMTIFINKIVYNHNKKYILPVLGYVSMKNDYRFSCRTETLVYNFYMKTRIVNSNNLILAEEVVDR